MTIHGTLIAIGGNEDKGIKKKTLHVQDTPHDFVTSGILYRVLTETNNPDAPIEVITTASSIPDKVGKDYVKAFRKLGHKKVKVMHVASPQEADDRKILDRIARAGCVMFSGGDQLQLTTVFRDTMFARLIHERYVNDHFIIAGTSAGAMAMSDLMIYPSLRKKGLTPEVRLFPGLCLVHDVIIDTHFLVRGRFRRLAVAVANNPTHIGIGLEEDTGVIIRNGNQLETIGSGLVTIIDGRSLQDANLTVAQEKHDIFIENMLVHVLIHGNNFTLRNKTFS
ncbi:cyanophycinase [Fibrisoma montanum]|uniref:Cyanophycinase n=1 Tax=Fibrisoma montanum TaxID=2305895 RepID=A0A418M4J2_9BACT|nr:cyanophycinase [Fibrisoma montanum]RIV20737.1 cyanophycinase [Fibrisoma montanum]